MEAASPASAGRRPFFMRPRGANRKGDIHMKKLQSTIMVMGLLLAVGQALAGPPGNKPPKGDGGDKGGFGDLGNGCVTFLNPVDPDDPDDPVDLLGTVSDDGGGRYCNGSDGQVSVPVHLRLDTKKFNKNHRWFWVQGECLDSPLDVQAEAECNQLGEGVDGLRFNVTVVDDSVVDDPVDLNWTEMSADEVLDARMGILLENGHLYFDPNDCPEVPWEPIHVRCDADTAPKDGLCDKWTISTDPAFPTGTTLFSESASRACFKSAAYGAFYSEVRANFTMEVCVMGVSCD
jgi:hypothetical protein